MINVNYCYKNNLGLVLSINGIDEISNQHFTGLFRYDGQFYPIAYKTSLGQRLSSSSRTIINSLLPSYLDKFLPHLVNSR